MFLKKIKSLLVFSIPIIMGNLGQMFINAGDVFVAARHGTATVAAISIASALISAIFLFGLGLLLSISPVLSKRRGENIDISRFLKLTLFYALILSVIFCSLSWLLIPIIPLLGLKSLLVGHIQDYIFICGFSFVGAFVFQALKEFLQAREQVVFPNMVCIAAIFLNLLLNWIFVFGAGPIPPMGVSGLAVASVFVRTVMALVLLYHCRGFLKEAFQFDARYLWDVFRIGAPVSLSLLLEISAFSIIAVIAGKISMVQVASHNIVLTFISTTFMIPLAVSNALAVRVGYAYGAGDYTEIRDNLYAAMVISMMTMGGFALLFLAAPEFLMALFSNDVEIIRTGAALLFIAAVFQVFDGAQVTLSGTLRGLGMTKPIMITMFLGYWLIGLPFGYYLAFGHKLEILGLWVGLATALFACAAIFSVILIGRLRKIRVKWT